MTAEWIITLFAWLHSSNEVFNVGVVSSYSERGGVTSLYSYYLVKGFDYCVNCLPITATK
jgi:hypothetical protein